MTCGLSAGADASGPPPQGRRELDNASDLRPFDAGLAATGTLLAGPQTLSAHPRPARNQAISDGASRRIGYGAPPGATDS